MRDEENSREYLEKSAENAWKRGDPREAILLSKQLRDSEPYDPELQSDFIFKLHFLDTPHALGALELARYRELFEPHGKRVLPAWKRKQSGKLRIGYVSPDLYGQASHYVLLPILQNHDKSKFEIFIYCTHSAYDDYTKEIQVHADAWRTIDHNNYELLLDTIENDEIDILVDLAGHTGINSLPLFAERAAPVQVSWFGYMGSTGLLNMDYRFTDEWRLPKEFAEYYSEHLYYLPNSYTFSPLEKRPSLSLPPNATENYVTFGSLNSHLKLSTEVLSLWSNILSEAPASKFKIFACPDLEYAQWIKNFFKTKGIHPDRIEPRPRTSMYDFLDGISDIDIALDPFPYTGGVTTYHALSMGVPTITLEGTHEYARNCAAILREAGLDRFVAKTKEEYIKQALELSNERELLRNLRGTLPEELVKRSGAITRHIEAAYREMDQQVRAMHGER